MIGATVSGAAVAQTVPGGSNTDVQYNASGSFGGSNSFTWNGTQATATGFVATTPTGTSDMGIKTNQTGPTTGTQTTETDFNQFNVNSDAIDLTAGGVTINGLELNYNFGGANLAGARSGEQINMTLAGTSTQSGDANPFYTGIVSNMEINGKAGNSAAEAIDGVNAFVHLTNTAAAINTLAGFEADLVMEPGTSASGRSGYSAVAYGNVQGTSGDSAYTLSSNTTTSHGWKTALALGNYAGGAALDSTVGCVICTDGSADTIANGINLSSYTITGYPFYFTMTNGQKIIAESDPEIYLDNGTASSSPNLSLGLNGVGKGQLVANSGYNLELYDIGHGKNLIGAYNTGDVAVGDTSDTETLRLYGKTMTASGYLCLTSGVASTGSSCSSSDARLKNVKSEISPANALKEVSELKPVVYTWKDEKRGKEDQIGLIAQDVEKVFPSVVAKGSDGYKTLDYARLVAPLIAAVQELKSENDALRKCQRSILAEFSGERDLHKVKMLGCE